MSDESPLTPVPDESFLTQVEMLLEARRPHDAIELLKEALRSAPDDSELAGAMGLALLSVGDVEQARVWAERSLRLDSSSAWVHDVRARIARSGPIPRWR